MGAKRKPIEVLDNEAREEQRTGSNKKKFHSKDLNQVRPLNHTQEEFFQVFNDLHVFAHGSAGTGKTFLAMYLGLREVLNPDTPYDRLVIVRSIVPTRDIGFLPGTIEEKIMVYEEPYRAMCNRLFPYAKSYDNLKKNGYLDFMCTSFMRGDTLENCVVIVDECQNMTLQEADTVITRMGENTKVIFCGDTKQTDLTKRNDQSGIKDFTRIIESMKEFGVARFLPQDVVRSGMVKSYLLVKESLGL